MQAAYRGLRETRINDSLKLAAGKIEINQSFQVIPNQKAALKVLSIVRGGLIGAGEKVDLEEQITAAMTPSDIIDVQPKPKAQDVATTAPATTEPADVATVSPEELLGNLSVGADPVTAAINAAWEANDAALARTRYLSQNSADAEMPRYVKLKRGILLDKLAGGLKAVDQATEASQKSKAVAVQEMLEGVKHELTQSKSLIEAKQLSALTQQIQADVLESLDDLRRRFIPLQKAVKEAAEENTRQGGADAFSLKYLIRDNDLDQAVAMIDGLNQFAASGTRCSAQAGSLHEMPGERRVVGVYGKKQPRGRRRNSDARRRSSGTFNRSWSRSRGRWR